MKSTCSQEGLRKSKTFNTCASMRLGYIAHSPMSILGMDLLENDMPI